MPDFVLHPCFACNKIMLANNDCAFEYTMQKTIIPTKQSFVLVCLVPAEVVVLVPRVVQVRVRFGHAGHQA